MQLSKLCSRALLPVLCCLMALLFAACGSSPSSTSPTGATKAPASKQIAILAKDVEGVPDLATLDPGLSTDAPSITAIDTNPHTKW
jgi:oligopeptide transport system substrate-binding protein